VEEVAARGLPVPLRGGEVLAGLRGDVRVAVDLAVRVVQGHADLDAAVLEAEDLCDVAAGGKLGGALGERPDDEGDAFGGEVDERGVVVVGEDDDLAAARGGD
ncbi:hypothetical protein ADL26_20860, partial [Thermoactinomyces vulgaris]